MHAFLILSLHFALKSVEGMRLHSVLDVGYGGGGKSITRDSNGSARFTLYEPGLGACGGYNGPQDSIVALNSPEWAGGSHCDHFVTIKYNGKSVNAKIVDECMGCPAHALDLSPGIFALLADEGEGVIYGDWEYAGAVQPVTATTHHSHTATQASTPTLSPSPSAITSNTPTDNADTTVIDDGILYQLNILAIQLGRVIAQGSTLGVA